MHYPFQSILNSVVSFKDNIFFFFPGYAAKSLPSTSVSSLSSSPSTSITLSPGRAKMSVSGPASSKPLPPPTHFSVSSCGTASSSPSVSPAPHKIHRARKTMNRPPPGQVRLLRVISSSKVRHSSSYSLLFSRLKMKEIAVFNVVVVEG